MSLNFLGFGKPLVIGSRFYLYVGYFGSTSLPIFGVEFGELGHTIFDICFDRDFGIQISMTLWDRVVLSIEGITFVVEATGCLGTHMLALLG